VGIASWTIEDVSEGKQAVVDLPGGSQVRTPHGFRQRDLQIRRDAPHAGQNAIGADGETGQQPPAWVDQTAIPRPRARTERMFRSNATGSPLPSLMAKTGGNCASRVSVSEE
jgi:hypothetical protein